MFDGKAFGAEIVAKVKAYVSDVLAPFAARLDAVEQRMAAPVPVSVEDLRTVRSDIESLRQLVSEIPPPAAMPDVVALVAEAVGQAIASMPPAEPGKSVDPADVKAMVDEAVAALPPAVPGKDADPERVRALVVDAVESAVAALPPAEKGKDADMEALALQVRAEAERILAGWPRPENGKSVTVEDLRPLVEDTVCKAVSAIRVPLDGKPGLDAVKFFRDADRNLIVTMSNGEVNSLGPIDGRDGFGFDDLDVTYDGERTFALKFARAGDAKEFVFRLPIVLDRGVFKEGQAYEKGDGVTWGGQYWIAREDTTAKPELNGGPPGPWRLAVKKGQNGKDGVLREPVKPGPVKVG